jgi:hypothetical protein
MLKIINKSFKITFLQVCTNVNLFFNTLISKNKEFLI